MNIFVTGAASALGRGVVQRLLAAGHHVTATAPTADASRDLRGLGAIPANPDLTRTGELISLFKAMNIDVLIHLAGQTVNHVPQIAADWSGVLPLLEHGTPALVAAAAATDVKYILLGSYALVYGNTGHDPADEQAAPQPAASPVIRAALAAEEAVIASDIPAAVLRFGYWYEAHCPYTLALRKAVRTGSMVPGGDVANWVHVDDAVQAVERVLAQRPTDEIYNIVDDEPLAVSEFTGIMAANINVTPSRLPGFLQRVRLGELQTELLTLSTRASNAKAKADLDWSPTYPTARVGIDRVLLVLRAEEPVV